jgi:hypothetical protein
VSDHADKAFAAPRPTSLFLRPRIFSAGRANGAVTYAEGRTGDFAIAAGHRLPTLRFPAVRCRYQRLALTLPLPFPAFAGF